MTNGVTALLTLLVSLLAIRSARGFGYIEPGYLDGPSCTMVSEPNYWCNDYISLSTDGTTTMVEDCVAQADALNVCPTNYISFAYNDNDGHSWCDCCGESWTPDSNDYGGPEETGGTYFCE